MALHAIPTLYRDRWYRSRLEARWAAFFDLLGWKFEYEPCDFAGWIPDFVLCEATPTYVEVKPLLAFDESIAQEMETSGCKDDLLLVGATLPHDEQRHGPYLGWLAEHMGPPETGWCFVGAASGAEHSWGLATFGVWTPQAPAIPRRYGFCHEFQGFHDRISGGYDGGCSGAEECDFPAIQTLWQQAGNEIQWKKPRHQ